MTLGHLANVEVSEDLNFMSVTSQSIGIVLETCLLLTR
jgi:hypothetical protein